MSDLDETNALEASAYYVAAVNWEPNDSPFASDTEYTAIVTLEAVEGNRFDSACTASVDGNPAAVVAGAGSQTLTVAYTYPVTGFDYSSAEIKTVSIKFCMMTAEAGKGGSITPEGNTPVRGGTDMEFTITPDGGCEIAEVLVDGESVGEMETCRFNSIDANHTVQVVFSRDGERIEGIDDERGEEDEPVVVSPDSGKKPINLTRRWQKR